MNTNMSTPFLSADRRATYVTLSNGQRRRVEIINDTIVFRERSSKADRKAAKRARMRARQVDEHAGR